MDRGGGIPSEFDPFLEAILCQPNELTPRRIFADYLEEQGDPRADFLRWSAAAAEAARSLPWSRETYRQRKRLPKIEDEARLRIYACLCVRFTPWPEQRLLGLRTVLQRTWDWLLPSAQSAVAASELYAADLFTANRLRRSMRSVRAMTPEQPSQAQEQAMRGAADAAHYAAAEEAESLVLAATSAENAVYWMEQAARAKPRSHLSQQVRGFQQSLLLLVAETPIR